MASYWMPSWFCVGESCCLSTVIVVSADTATPAADLPIGMLTPVVARLAAFSR